MKRLIYIVILLISTGILTGCDGLVVDTVSYDDYDSFISALENLECPDNSSKEFANIILGPSNEDFSINKCSISELKPFSHKTKDSNYPIFSNPNIEIIYIFNNRTFDVNYRHIQKDILTDEMTFTYEKIQNGYQIKIGELIIAGVTKIDESTFEMFFNEFSSNYTLLEYNT